LRKVDLAIVGAGPAGLTAAIEGAKRGCSTVVVDRNPKPGGQLIKQIHKFFGSREHRAGTRGVDIAQDLFREAQDLGVTLMLGWEVYDIQPGWLEVVQTLFEESTRDQPKVAFRVATNAESIAAKKIVLATGAEENAIHFDGWTLPGVMGAGAAQTMINVWRVLPGNRVLMVGSGNVGLIVTYQLLQAGADVVAILDAAPKIGGYGVHAAKVRRAGVAILTAHTIVRALGDTRVTGAIVAKVDNTWRPVPGSEKRLDVDTICVAIGLRPNTRLASLAGCQLTNSSVLGGWVPIHNGQLETTVPGIYVAGDVSGIEEASTALEEGKLTGIAAASAMGKTRVRDQEELQAIADRLCSLRGGPFCQPIQDAKQELVDLGEAVCPKR